MDFHITSITKGGLEVRPSKSLAALMKRIDDPQDLEDGLLAVEYDQAKEQLVAKLRETNERRILDLFVRR